MLAGTRSARRWVLLLAALVMAMTACTGDGPTGGDGDGPDGDGARETVDGGTVVFGADQEPLALSTWLDDSFATQYMVNPVLYPLWRVTPDFRYEPLLLDGEPEAGGDPFTVTYRLRDAAVWSDGTPLTVDDIEFTLDHVLDPDADIISREGYDAIDRSRTERVDDKTITYTFSQPYAPWRTLFSVTPILPRHALEGEDDIAAALTESIPVASGPFRFDSWNKGRDLTLVRNDAFWGETTPSLERVIFRFIPDAGSMVQGLRGGEIDLFYVAPEPETVEQVASIRSARFDVAAGLIWEHVDFNFQVPPLDRTYVRQAIIQGIDREAMTREFIEPMHPGAEVLQNLVYVNDQAEYEPHFDRWSYDPEAAVALLRENGCTRGDDDVFVCEGQRLSIEYATTGGNELRRLQLEFIQAQLREIGVEIVAKLADPSTGLGPVLMGGSDGAWGLINFGWAGSPDPHDGNGIWVCDGDQNYNGYCNREVTLLLEETATTIDAAERARLFNEADALMARDVPVIPLYQKPTLFAWREGITGARNNATQWGPTWNIEEWALTR